MHVYCGRLNWLSSVDNECITVVFPGGLGLQDPVCACWQWSMATTIDQRVNDCQVSSFSARFTGLPSREWQYGLIKTVTKTSTQYIITFAGQDYLVDAEFSADLTSMTMKMYVADGLVEPSSVSTLQKQMSTPSLVPSTKVFTGKINWSRFAFNEMVTLVVPNGVADGARVGLYFQWTTDWDGGHKSKVWTSSTFYNVSENQGIFSASFDGHYYKFDITVYPDSGLRNSNARISMREFLKTRWTSDVQQTDWRQLHRKKALIVRYGTGTDNGIFLLRDMLTTDLGFDAGDVDMVYYHHEPADSIAVIPFGQQAPTAANFKAKLTSFLSSAETGDVRFLYLDTLAETGPAGTADEEKGIVLAANDEGRERETVYNEWLATVIRENLKTGVNLTILTSSCLGSGMLGSTTATGGILLSACHETQSNFKALQVNGSNVDPWLYAIIAVIKKQVKDQRSVPTYSFLFTSAKKFIKMQLAHSALDDRYKGPSTDELSPTMRKWDLGTSNQDPQLIYFNGYVNPHEERFLFPFVLARSGQAIGEQAVRFPRDEYPTSCTL
ncbi:hypothetical protein EV122DRAFT_208258 [Schizophyllum commune]